MQKGPGIIFPPIQENHRLLLMVVPTTTEIMSDGGIFATQILQARPKRTVPDTFTTKSYVARCSEAKEIYTPLYV